MLHEILLSLSGHSSPLLSDAFSSRPPPQQQQHSPVSALTPPERDLLADLARLADLHVRLRAHAAHIAAVHPSVVCRAVAAAIISVHLAAFQRDVLAVESTVLRRDAALVGAYDIVPLTAVVGAFADWPRRMEWLWAVAVFILPPAATQAPPAGTPASKQKAPAPATSSSLIDHLRAELLTGYEDIERAARSLIRVAETAWIKQVSAWILYGRLPFDGGSAAASFSLKNDDFFVQQQASTADTTGEYVCLAHNLPSFVTSATAASMLFIGRSLVHLRAKTDSSRQANGPKASHWLAQNDFLASTSSADGGFAGAHLSSQLQALAQLTYPLDGAAFARTIAHIRAFLSRTALRKLLPPSKVVDMLQLLRDFYLLGRGEFAMALVEQADETMRSRWQRADATAASGSARPHPHSHSNTVSKATLTPSGARGMKAALVKDGEVAAVLARTWAMLAAMSGRHANDDQGEEEDEGMELARETLRLVLQKGTPSGHGLGPGLGPSAVSTFTTPHNLRGPRQKMLAAIASTPFQNLLFSVPASLTLQIPYPLDLVLSTADMQAYAAIHAYLLSIRRAHIRLTGLWKLSSLRRHHPPPPAPPYGGRGRYRIEQVQMLRARHTERANALRSVWATTSAAIFFLAELEGYLQMEVVVELWDGFREWLGEGTAENGAAAEKDGGGGEEQDIWMAQAEPDLNSEAKSMAAAQIHDPQSLATAHRRYLRQLVRRLLLDQGPRWTEPLYALLVSVDQLSALVHRLQSLWQALDLEADAGVVDAFVDLEREQQDALDALAGAEQSVRQGVLAVVGVLRELEREADDRGDVEDGEDDDDYDDDYDDESAARAGGGGGRGGGQGLRPAGAYVPRRIGGLDRLLMKLDFGSWGG